MKTALTIAGSDSSGGAGIQADIKTMTANGVYAMSAITALTAQNTTGVKGISEVTPQFLELQLDSVISDIRPDAVKIGMVSSGELIEVIYRKLCEYKLNNIVIDPVMLSSSGTKLLSDAAITELEKLFMIADVITPNIPEAEVLSGIKIKDTDYMVRAAEVLNSRYGCSVLLKGGHKEGEACDILYSSGAFEWFSVPRINNSNNHGTGCTLSSAIAANLAKGCELSDAVMKAKAYITGALSAMLDLGHGSGPMNHLFDLKSEFI